MAKCSNKGHQDLNQLAVSIVNKATGDAPIENAPPAKNKNAVALGRLGGLKGGNARAESLTSERRSQIAKKAALTRWGKK
jgi:hypothetical protein